MTYLEVFKLALPIFQRISSLDIIAESYTLGKSLRFDAIDEIHLLMDIEAKFDIMYTSKEAEKLFTSTNTVKEICESIQNKIMEKSNVKPVTLKKPKTLRVKPPVIRPYGLEDIEETFISIKEMFENEEVCSYFKETEVEFVVEKEGRKMFSFEINEFTHCCGAIILGTFDWPQKLTPVYWTTVEEDIVEIMNTIPQLTANKGRTLTCTTATKTSSEYLGEALEKCDFWTPVKSWVNTNSKNTVTLWVSNNQ